MVKFGVKIFPNDCKTADGMKICFTAGPACIGHEDYIRLPKTRRRELDHADHTDRTYSYMIYLPCGDLDNEVRESIKHSTCPLL